MKQELLSPSLGPLVGHVTQSAACLWIRGEEVAGHAGIGMAALFDDAGQYLPNSACYFELPPAEEYCGVVNFSGLQENTAYKVRCGMLVVEKSSLCLADAHGLLGPAVTWLSALSSLPDYRSQAFFRTCPASPEIGMSFLIGSCRYPGLFWPARESDRIFASMQSLCRTDTGIRFVLMCGDQIYADKLPAWLPFCKAETPAAFSRRYQAAYSTPGMHDLLRSVPNYMILDDHEIENNWNAGRLEGKRKLFDAAISAYRRYQWLHSPRNFSAENEVLPGTGDQLYFSFECSGYPFFVIDSRSMRVQDDKRCSLSDNHLLGSTDAESPFFSRQLDTLCGWLVALQQQRGNAPKFIVSPCTFVPNEIETAGNSDSAMGKKCKDDAWAAFPATRRKLLQTIVKESIQNVVFLCGDAHSSFVAEIDFVDRLSGRLPLRAYSITASAFYWPWPFSRGGPCTHVMDSNQQGDGFEVNAQVSMHYRVLNHERQNSFTKVTLQAESLLVQRYDRNGVVQGDRGVLKFSQ